MFLSFISVSEQCNNNGDGSAAPSTSGEELGKHLDYEVSTFYHL